jgi:glucokinase
MNLIGIDVGGTKTSICLGTEKGELIGSERFPSAEATTQEEYFASLKTSVLNVLRNGGVAPEKVDGVGISAPGPLDVKRGVLIAPPNNPGWRDVPFVSIVKSWLSAPVWMNHDGKASVLAEWHFGRFRGTRNLIYLTFSTGMGAGIILNGQLVQGETDSAGEVGHHILDPQGPLCGCGMRGCWESYVGGRNVALRLQERIRNESIQTALTDLVGGAIDKISMVEFEKAARQGDAFAMAEWEMFTDRVAQGIGNLIMIFNPDAIVLGTIAIHGGDFVMDPIRQKIPRYTWDLPRQHCQVVPSILGRRIGDLGALAVAISGLAAR